MEKAGRKHRSLAKRVDNPTNHIKMRISVEAPDFIKE